MWFRCGVALCINSNVYRKQITLIVLHIHAYTHKSEKESARSSPLGGFPPPQLAQCGPVLSPSAAAAALPCDIGQVVQS